MLATQRKSTIIERVRRDGSVVAAELAAEWNVSEDTVRRDLRELAAAGLVHRVHGGAVRTSAAAADYGARTSVASEEKSAVAHTAASLILPGQTVFLDGGTTTAALCRSLPTSLEVTVVTHSPTVALALTDHDAVQVLLIGGRLYRHSLVTVGAVAIEYVNQLSLDLFFMGVSGVHPTHGLTTGDAEEAAMKRAICRRAADTYVLASSEKLNSVMPHRVVAVEEVTAAITDSTDRRSLAALRRAGLRIISTS